VFVKKLHRESLEETAEQDGWTEKIIELDNQLAGN